MLCLQDLQESVPTTLPLNEERVLALEQLYPKLLHEVVRPHWLNAKPTKRSSISSSAQGAGRAIAVMLVKGAALGVIRSEVTKRHVSQFCSRLVSPLLAVELGATRLYVTASQPCGTIMLFSR